MELSSPQRVLKAASSLLLPVNNGQKADSVLMRIGTALRKTPKGVMASKKC